AAAFRAAWRAAIENGAVASSTGWRWEKTYGDPFEYLGWCSWEHYKKEIDAESMAAAVRELTEGEAPVRWVLIDDGHQLEHGLRLKSFAPDPAKFPDGWGPIVGLRDPRSIRWIGLWHCFQGLWKTLDEENDFGDLNDDLARLPTGGYLPRGDEAAASRFYDRLIGSATDAGFDFVKIDVQASNVGWYRGTANAVEASAHNAHALEAAVHERLPHGMINCMAHNILCIFNTRHSAVSRCSIDYHLNDADSIASHIVQSYTNSLWMGWSVWPDHDMFHSSDAEAGRMMAVSKALSGAPVYLSDAPSQIRADLVRPLCLSDGRLLRPLAPAAPVPESTFLDALGEADRPYLVVAPLTNRCAAVAAYNLVQEPTRVRGSVGADAYRYAGMLLADDAAWEVPDEGVVAYEWYTGRTTRLGRRTPRVAEALAVDLGHLEDSLVLLCPVVHGWAVIGRADVYLSPAAVTSVERTAETVTVTLAESGPLLVWSDGDPVRCDEAPCTPLGEGLWRVELDVRPAERRITVSRA
ncbi:MAG: Sip1-related alpha-galactosidase, partial [Spirochaetota bacterium]